MTAAFIILLVVALLFVLPIGLIGIYKDEKYAIFLYVLRIKNKIAPSEKKKKGKSDTKKILQALYERRDKISIDRLGIKYVAAAEDPFDAVKKYSTANAAIGTLINCLERISGIKEKKVFTDLDMNAEKSVIEFEIKLSLHILDLLHIYKAAKSSERKPSYGKQTQ